MPSTSTTLMSCELVADPAYRDVESVRPDGRSDAARRWMPMYDEAVESPHPPSFPPPGKGKLSKGKGKTSKGKEKGGKHSTKGDKGKTKGSEKGGKQSTKGDKGDKGIEKGGKQSTKGDGNSGGVVIHRGGWFSKCQRISLAVLSADHETSMALAEEFYAGPEEW